MDVEGDVPAEMAADLFAVEPDLGRVVDRSESDLDLLSLLPSRRDVELFFVPFEKVALVEMW